MQEWLAATESRIGLGCMRLSTERDRDEARAIATIHAALDAGVTVFDTARAYGLDDADRGHNERLLARALATHAAGACARVVTKGGMARPDGSWRPDGRAHAILADCEASLRALDGRPIDLYLLHAPDPRTPWATSVRALAGLVERGLVGRVGICNVNRRQLVEALELAPLAAIEVALGAGDDEALRGGVVALALERGLWLLAHAPLGGPKRAAGLRRDAAIAGAAARLGATPAQLILSGVVALHPRVVALPGARRPET
ncbi:MAG: aldo/keto reductase, partial [Polyangia bacterium]